MYASAELRGDREVVRAAVEQSGLAFFYTNENTIPHCLLELYVASPS